MKEDGMSLFPTNQRPMHSHGSAATVAAEAAMHPASAVPRPFIHWIRSLIGRLALICIATLVASVVQAGDTYELRIIKYNDLDQDGTNDELNTSPGDPQSGNALTGWEFTVYDGSGSQVAQGVTSLENPGANGDLGLRVSFPDLISGQTYTICETQQADWVNTQPGTVDSTYGEPCETVTFSSTTSITRYFGNFLDNAAPVANAGPDQTVLDADNSGGELVALDGTGSSDPDGALESSDHVWTQNGTQIATGAITSFTFPVGVHEVVLTVTDEAGATDSDTVQITVEEPDIYTLRVIKYHDLDRDGTNDELNFGPGAPPSGNALTGWQFTVYDDSGSQVAQGATSVENANANGDLGIRVSFPGLISGRTYTICETQQPGWVNSQPGTIDPAYGQPCRTGALTSSTAVFGYFGNFRSRIFTDRFQP